MTNAAVRIEAVDHTRLANALVWGVFALCWFATIQLRPIFDPDEGRYAEIPREMWISGDWVTPRLNEVVYFEKPPLQYWTTAAAYAAFGLQEWTSRAWSFTLAFLTIPMTSFFASRLHGPAQGLAAAAVLAISPYFVLIGHLNLLDSAFSFFLVGAVFAFLLAQREQESSKRERRWMLLAWTAAALAVLSKGIVAPVLAGATLIAYSLLTRDWRAWRRLHVTLGLPLFLLITVPWFWMVSQRHPQFLQFFFVHEHLERFTTTIHNRVEPWWYFLPIVLLGVAPVINHLWRALRAAWLAPNRLGGIHVERFLVIWVVVVVGLFSASGSKLASYVMPVMPPLAVLLAVVIAADPRGPERVRWPVLGTVAIVALGWVIYAIHRNPDVSPPLIYWAIAAILAAAIAAVFSRADVGRSLGNWRYAPLAVGSLLAWQFLQMSYAELKPARTSKALAAEVRDSIGPDTTIFSVGQYRQGIPVYLNRTMRVVSYQGELEFELEPRCAAECPVTLPAFEREWLHARDAIAFIAPPLFEQLRARGIPGVIVSRDARSVVLRRL